MQPGNATAPPPPLAAATDQPHPPYGIWHTHNNVSAGPVYYVPYSYNNSYQAESWRYWNISPTDVHSAFVHYWHYSILAVVIYVAVIHGLEWWMSSRRAYVLKWQLVAWNGWLAVFSTVAAWRMSAEAFYVISERGFRDSVCLAVDPAGPAGFWSTLFALSKVAELFDTVFIVLRKRPLIFLHWYHHAVVLVYCCHSAIAVTAAGRWFVTMNFFVHSFMYTYYTIVSTGLRFPRPVSMMVTTLQIGQMLIGVAVSSCIAYIKWSEPGVLCQQTTSNLVFCFTIYLTFAFLFIHFFVKAYFPWVLGLAGKSKSTAGKYKKLANGHGNGLSNGKAMNGSAVHQANGHAGEKNGSVQRNGHEKKDI